MANHGTVKKEKQELRVGEPRKINLKLPPLFIHSCSFTFQHSEPAHIEAPTRSWTAPASSRLPGSWCAGNQFRIGAKKRKRSRSPGEVCRSGSTLLMRNG